MSRYHSHGPHRDPISIHLDRPSLDEAKLAAWAFAIGEGPADRLPGRRRLHRGLLPDLPDPEPPHPVRGRRLADRLSALIARLFGRHGMPEGQATAHGAGSADIRTFDRTTPARSTHQETADAAEPIPPRAA